MEQTQGIIKTHDDVYMHLIQQNKNDIFRYVLTLIKYYNHAKGLWTTQVLNIKWNIFKEQAKKTTLKSTI